MSHGEYVALENLEMIYGTSQFVSPNGICVYGDSFHDSIVALIIPQETYCMAWAKERDIKGTFAELCKNEELRKAVKEDFQRIATEKRKKSFEVIKDFRLYPDG